MTGDNNFLTKVEGQSELTKETNPTSSSGKDENNSILSTTDFANDEELEYESHDEEEFEKIYQESQLGVYEDVILNSGNEIDDTILNEKDFDAEFEINDDGPLIDERTEQEHYEQEFEAELEQEQEEGQNRATIGIDEVLDEVHDDLAIDGEADGNTAQLDNDFELEVLNEQREYVDVFSDSDEHNEVDYEDDDELEITKVNDRVIEILDNETMLVGEHDTQKEDDKLDSIKDTETSSLEEVDDFDDFEKEIELIGKLSKVRVYFDFCDLITESDRLSTIGLDGIKPAFDIMQLFNSDSSSDEINSELSCIYEEFENCINLTFKEVFAKLAELMGLDLSKHIINLNIPELLDMKISSDSKSSLSLHLREILIVYEKLREQSANSDLYKFLSIRVSCSLNVAEQLSLLSTATGNGYHFGNIKEIINKRPHEDETETFEDSNKRLKL